jgi:allantoin racemase
MPRSPSCLKEHTMSRILYIAPVNVEGDFLERDVEDAARTENDVTVVGFSRGPLHVEYHYYETLVLPDIIHTVMEAERLGYDAAVIGCFYDLGLQESREVAKSIVVTAPCEASCLLAASLGSTFSIIVGRRKWVPQMRNTRRATQSTLPRARAA